VGRERVEVRYTGDVQGVGFRWRATHCAEGRGVDGWVRNLPDGSVELVAEGPRAAVEAFLAAIREEMGRLIRDERAVWSSAAGGLPPFTIRR
jgi:acylphosphatase